MRQSRAWGLVFGVAAAVQVAAAAGCASTQAKLEQWQGRPISELIAARGEADRIMSYPFGGSLYIWEKRQSRIASGGADSRRGGAYLEDVVTTQAFLVDEGGVITRIQTKTAVAAPVESSQVTQRTPSRR
jgi:hypothetical protein